MASPSTRMPSHMTGSWAQMTDLTPPAGRIRVPIDELESMANEALARLGYDAEESRQIVEVLIYADVRGNDQGVVKLIGEALRKSSAAGDIGVEQRGDVSALIDGNQAAGILALRAATDVAAEMCTAAGVAVVGTHNTSDSTGCLGFYAKDLASRGFLCLIFAGSKPSVAAYGSYEKLLGTNPLAVGIPSDGDPVVLDMATSATTNFGLLAAETAQRAIPPDVAFGPDGEPTTEAAQALEGAIRTFDRSYKGWGLSLVVELLTGPFVAASFGGLHGSDTNWGNLIICLDPGLFVDRRVFGAEVSEFITRAKSTNLLPEVGEVMLPGERGDRLAVANRAVGTVEIDEAVFAALTKVIR